MLRGIAFALTFAACAAQESRANTVPSAGQCWYINFQDPNGQPTANPLVVGGKTYLKAGPESYSTTLGFGWIPSVSPAAHIVAESFDQWALDDLDRSGVCDDYGRVNTWEFALPNGIYGVTVRVGRRSGTRVHKIVAEGVTIVDQSTTGDGDTAVGFVSKTASVTVTDKRLSLVIGKVGEINGIRALQVCYQGAADACAGVVCTAASQCHAIGTCSAGTCSNPFKPSGTPCDDGSSATVNDVCDGSGVCKGSSWVPAQGSVDQRTYKLTSTASFTLWTTLPSRKVFQNDPIPTATGSDVKVFMAKNEFEPFVVVVTPSTSGAVTVQAPSFPNGITVEISQVKYVSITTPTDYTGRTGPNPDPLWPLANGASVSVIAGTNVAFWFTVFVPPSALGGDFVSSVNIGGTAVTVTLHVFNFQIPATLHVNSFFDSSAQTVLDKYGVTGTSTDYWSYVDKYNQYFYDHRMAPTSPFWPGGLTAKGAPYISYDCATNTWTDRDGIWGFEKPADRWISGQASRTGVGFPSFTASKFVTNSPKEDQRPTTFCGQTRVDNDYGRTSNAYNVAWYAYIKATRDYLSQKGLLSKAYYYMANEPQDATDYDAIVRNCQSMKQVAPDYKLAVSEEPKPEIWEGCPIDIWIPHYGNSLNRTVINDRTTKGQDTWWYFLHSTYFPRINPITIDHVGFDARAMGWAMWQYRLRGVAYYQWNNWDSNPWTPTPTFGQNGNTFLVYPPTEDNSKIAFGANGHRFVPSIRWELMRDSLEDFEYFWLLNGNNYASGDVDNTKAADRLVGQIVGAGTSSFNRDDDVLYTIRRLVGQFLAGEISSIPAVTPRSTHSRQDSAPGNYYINFQDPSSEPVGDVVYNGKTFTFKIGADPWSDTAGYGWHKAADGNLKTFYDVWQGGLTGSAVVDDYGRENIFEFALPNGKYTVTICSGRRTVQVDHLIVIEGVVAANTPSAAGTFIWPSVTVAVTDKRLTIALGKFGVMDFLNAVMIEYAGPISVVDSAHSDSHSLPMVSAVHADNHGLPLWLGIGAVCAALVIVATVAMRRAAVQRVSGASLLA